MFNNFVAAHNELEAGGHLSSWNTGLKTKQSEAVPLHAMVTLGGRGV
jgi:hypothetical protein